MKPILLASLAAAAMLQDVAAAESQEAISEVIPIKNACASEIAAELNSTRTNFRLGWGRLSNRFRSLFSRSPSARPILISGQWQIIADERANSLTIRAPAEEMKTLKDFILSLDLPNEQVLIEALVVEVPLSDPRKSVLSHMKKSPVVRENYLPEGGAFASVHILSVTNFVTVLNTNKGGNESAGFVYVAKLGSDFDALLTALAGDIRVRILQRPRIPISQGVDAQIFIGESRSYQEIDIGLNCTGIGQLWTGVTLSLTPFVKPDGATVINLHQTVANSNGTVKIENVGEVPITSTTESESSASVRDHDTILLGGYITEDKPRRATVQSAQRELIVFIRPTVLPASETGALAAQTERDRTPGTKAAEWKFSRDEIQRMRQMQAEEYKHFEAVPPQ